MGIFASRGRQGRHDLPGCRRVRGGLRVVMVGVLLSGGAARAQAPSATLAPEEQELRRPARAAATARRALAAAEEAELFVPFEESRRVRYAEVLRNPDNIRLNFRWAQTQVVDGDLPGASATLERILLLRPDLVRVRLFYALVLFRLGNLREADEELVRLERVVPDPAMRAQIDDYRGRIAQYKKTTHYTAALSLGGQHDTNRNAAPRSGEVLIGSTRFNLGADNSREDDTSALALVDLRFERELGYQEGHSFVAGLSYYQTRQDDLRSLDVLALTAEVGLSLRTGRVEWRPSLFSSMLNLSSENYLRSYGFALGVERALSKQATLYGRARFEYEDFDAIPEAPDSDERSGQRSQLVAGVRYLLNPRHQIDLSGGVTNKSAQRGYNGYVAGDLAAAHTWLLGRGQFLISSLSVQGDRYKNSQISISESRRGDLKTRARVIYGVPVSSLLPWETRSVLRDLVVSLTGEYLWAGSRLPNYAYRNRRVSLMFTRRVQF